LAQINALGLNMIPVITDNRYKITGEALKKTIQDFNAKVVIINNPCNPSGAVYSYEELVDMYLSILDTNAIIISDEVYSRQIYDDDFFSISSIDQCRDRVVLVNGFSKSFAMTGWRIGVATGPKEIIRLMMLLGETVYSCVNQFVQIAAAKALTGDQREVNFQNTSYKIRRDRMISAINGVKSLSCHVPSGGLYCWAKILNEMDSIAYGEWALSRGVVLSPGWMFGQSDHVRFSFASSDGDIEEGIGRLIE
jgi:aspartate/methionine/tyrosine aminotransferase